MKCPVCSAPDTKVIDSRPSDEDSRIRRRRECISCGRRFTTYEALETVPLVVVKKNGSRELFDSEKLLRSMLKACEKRQVSSEELTKICDRVEKTLQNRLEREISSNEIGELVMNELKNVDKVAYIRFASVYRDFRDIDTFIQAVNEIQTAQ
ncbi:MAG: transcriptional repressor NrdR [Oscillospiraceae bacterium]|nr:transcriptional repressor NrdR [Oscillospiraceae bacterium]